MPACLKLIFHQSALSGVYIFNRNAKMHAVILQDAHEFLYFLFNEISEVLEKSEKDKSAAATKLIGAASLNGSASSNGQSQAPKTWVHELFQGTMVNEMRCMQCETVTSREEAFYDLSLEIEHNSSVTSCLRNFRWCSDCCDLRHMSHCMCKDCSQSCRCHVGPAQAPNLACVLTVCASI